MNWAVIFEPANLAQVRHRLEQEQLSVLEMRKGLSEKAVMHDEAYPIR